MNAHESIHAAGQSQTKPRTRAQAKAKITYRVPKPSPTTRERAPALMEIRLHETFTGDLDDESSARALQVYATITPPASRAPSLETAFKVAIALGVPLEQCFQYDSRGRR